MFKISRLFNSLPKRLASGAILALAVALPIAASAADTVQISATTGVANVTAGDTTYASSVNATYNQVVKVQVAYTNDEPAGSTKNANGVQIKINVPNAAGATQTVTTNTAGSNTNSVNGSATINTGRSDAYLQYIPGTAEANVTDVNGNITHETSATDPSLENVVTSGFAINNGNPCQSAAVAVEVGVMVPGTSVTKQVELASQTNQWATTNTANPGDTLKYLITYKNTGNTTAKNVTVRDNLPPNLTYVPGSTVITDGNYPNGLTDKTNAVTTDGIIIGDAAPNAVAYVTLEAKVADATQLQCGDTKLTNVGIAHPAGFPEYYNTAYTDVNKTCNNTPTYTCDLFDVTKGDREVTVKTFNKSMSSDVTFKNVVINWGDNTPSLTTNTPVGQTHKYANYGTYALSAVAHFTVNGKDVQASSAGCAKPVTFTTPGTPTPPTTLVNTGAGNVVGIFAAVAVLGAFAHRLFLSRRLSRDS